MPSITADIIHRYPQSDCCEGGANVNNFFRIAVKFCAASVLAGFMGAIGPAAGALIWNVEYLDSGGAGFYDGALGVQRRTTLSSVLSYVSGVMSVENGTIDLRVEASQSDGTGFLAEGGTYFNPSAPAGYYNGFAYDHVRSGADPLATVPDARIVVDFGYAWNSGLGAPGANQYDLFSVLLHEITHTLGFNSQVMQDGSSFFGLNNPGIFNVFDSHLALAGGQNLFGPGGQFLGVANDLISGNVVFESPSSGDEFLMYSPDPFEDGSSLQHFSGISGAVMLPAYSWGSSIRSYSPADCTVLVDIGWNARCGAIPEPSPMWLLTIGLALVLVSNRNGGRRPGVQTPSRRTIDPVRQYLNSNATELR